MILRCTNTITCVWSHENCFKRCYIIYGDYIFRHVRLSWPITIPDSSLNSICTPAALEDKKVFLSPPYHEYFIGLICSNYWNSTQCIRLITRRNKENAFMCVNIWKSYTLRSYKEVVKKKYWGPYGISTHDHCDTGTALYGNAEVMGSNPERT